MSDPKVTQPFHPTVINSNENLTRSGSETRVRYLSDMPKVRRKSETNINDLEDGKNFLREIRVMRNPVLRAMGFYNRKESNKFAYIITAIIVSALAIAIGLTVHYVGADNILHWFQGDFTSFFKDTLVNWITNNSTALKWTAIGVGGVALGILLGRLAPKIKEKAGPVLDRLFPKKPEIRHEKSETSSDESAEDNFVGGNDREVPTGQKKNKVLTGQEENEDHIDNETVKSKNSDGDSSV